MSGGVATYATSTLTVGSHGITAVYSGDSVYESSISTTLTQTVQATVRVTVNAPVGRSFTVDGTTFTAPQAFDWLPGSNHTIATASTQSGNTGTRYVFASWSDGGASSHTIAVPGGSATYTATFGTQYQLTTALNPPSTGYVSPGSGWYNASTVVNLKATPNTGYLFAGWIGDSVVAPASAATTITLNGPKSVTGTFSGIPYLVAKVMGKTGSSTSRVWTIILTNSGTGTATNVKITNMDVVKWFGAACTPTITNSFPLPVSDIAEGSSQSRGLTLNFTGCAPATKFGATITFSYDDAGTITHSGSNSYYNMLW
jgi:hypothetical protein